MPKDKILTKENINKFQITGNPMKKQKSFFYIKKATPVVEMLFLNYGKIFIKIHDFVQHSEHFLKIATKTFGFSNVSKYITEQGKDY